MEKNLGYNTAPAKASEPDRKQAASSRLLSLLGLLLFFSGISGLIYQVLWLRRLSLVFGVTIYAASTVIAAFMAGLALGSFFAGRFTDRLRRPLLWYAVIEALIGLSALATPLALEKIEQLYVSLYPSLSDTMAALTLIRFLLCFAVLLAPTTLMGATLPIIIKTSLLHTNQLGEHVSFLYACNTAGAIAGTLLAGFYLIGSLGMTPSFRLAASLNLLVGIAAAIVVFTLSELRAKNVSPHGCLETEIAQNGEADEAVSERARKAVLFVFVLSGFVSLALEVVWFRALIFILGVTTYAFTVMLATFLFGIAVGSHWARHLMRRRIDLLALLGPIETAIGVLCPLSLVPFLLAPVGGMIALIIGVLTILPVTLLMGIAFPIGLRIWAAGGADSLRTAGRHIGTFYSLNVLGSIAGSVAAGFLLLPLLGTQKSLILLGVIGLGSGFLLLAVLPKTKRARSLRVAAGGAALFLISSLSIPNPFTIVLSHRHPGYDLLWLEEGKQVTASVQQSGEGRRFFYMDGVHQADDTSNVVDMHRAIADLPVMLLPDAADVLVIGLGGGVTAGAFSRHDNIIVDVVELSETVVRGSEWFGHVNYDVLQRPNVRLRIDDGRNYLMLTPRRYNVITADIIRPYQAGSGSLYSVEYFRLARNALKDGGLMVQWIDPSWSEEQYRLVMRTFLNAFPDATLWLGGSLMLGGKQPLRLDPASIEQNLERSRTLDAFKGGSVETVLSLYSAGPAEMRQFAGDGPLLTDDRPLIEYFISLPGADNSGDAAILRGDVMRHVIRTAKE
ncbi:MAG TPA: fused MFS/spermidine synthase [Blastocatellia bacterium]|nr:fused MFS/spermidine synthase [Blastocatellia bacterium]